MAGEMLSYQNPELIQLMSSLKTEMTGVEFGTAKAKAFLDFVDLANAIAETEEDDITHKVHVALVQERIRLEIRNSLEYNHFYVILDGITTESDKFNPLELAGELGGLRDELFWKPFEDKLLESRTS